ncbi:conserved hypothetical protein [Vibrio chagasii]|nr:conserved hypothetical protein [Vibrio chagasii]
MLLSFSVTNCRSFIDEQELKLCSKAKGVNTRYTLQSYKDNLVNRATCLFGANGAGRGNLLRALEATVKFMRGDRQHSIFKVLEPHMGNSDSPSKAKLHFVYDELEHLYELTIKDGVVEEEVLKVKRSSRYSKVFHVFEDEWIQPRNKGIQPLSKTSLIEHMLDGQTSFIDASARINSKTAQRLTDYLKTYKFGLDNCGVSYIKSDAIDVFLDDPELLKVMSDIFKSSDFGVDSIIIETENDKHRVIAKVAYGDKPDYADFPLRDIGSGAITLFNILSVILPVIRGGGVAVIKDMDQSLHSHLAEMIVNIFKDYQLGAASDAQLVCSVQHTAVMQTLTKQQVVFVNKKDNKSEIYSISDFQGVGNACGFEKAYLSGRFDALPDL